MVTRGVDEKLADEPKPEICNAVDLQAHLRTSSSKV